MKSKLIVIAGSTASGKTSLSVELAQQLNCPIISADSRQFYKELSIGTAKPTDEEMGGVKHYFIDSHSIKSPLSAGQFEKEALLLLENLFKKHEHIILVGGSGMFIKALVEGTNQLPHDVEVQKKWNDFYEVNGLSFLQNELKKIDPDHHDKIDINNPVRIIRALEIIEITGKKIADLTAKEKTKRNFITYYFVIDHPRNKLYNRINNRVEQMFENGLLDEVKDLEKHKHLQPLNTVGYKELFDYYDGKISLEEAKAAIKKNTRRYAKRQLTWFRAVPDAIFLEYCSNDKMSKFILQTIATDLS